MAGVHHFLAYMHTAQIYNNIHIHHHGGGVRPRGGVYTNCGILGQFVYTPRNSIHQAFLYFLLLQAWWWCIYMGSTTKPSRGTALLAARPLGGPMAGWRGDMECSLHTNRSKDAAACCHAKKTVNWLYGMSWGLCKSLYSQLLVRSVYEVRRL